MENRVRMKWLDQDLESCSTTEEGNIAPTYKHLNNDTQDFQRTNEKKIIETKPTYIDKILALVSDTDETVVEKPQVEIKEEKQSYMNQSYLNNLIKDIHEVKLRKSYSGKKDNGTFKICHYDQPKPLKDMVQILNNALGENSLTHTDLNSTSINFDCDQAVATKHKGNTSSIYRGLSCSSGDWKPPKHVTKTKPKQCNKNVEKKEISIYSYCALNANDVKKMISTTLQRYYKNKSLDDSNEMKYSCSIIADLIKSSVKHLYPCRYRLVCFVSIVQLKQQTVRIVSRALWDVAKDGYIEYSFMIGGYKIIVILFGIYKE